MIKKVSSSKNSSRSDTIKLDFDKAQGLLGRIRQNVSEMNDINIKMKRLTNSVAVNWQGSAGDAANSALTEWTAETDALIASVNEMLDNQENRVNKIRSDDIALSNIISKADLSKILSIFKK